MGLREKWLVLNALLWEDDDDEIDLDELLEDSDFNVNYIDEIKDEV